MNLHDWPKPPIGPKDIELIRQLRTEDEDVREVPNAKLALRGYLAQQVPNLGE